MNFRKARRLDCLWVLYSAVRNAIGGSKIGMVARLKSL